MWQFVQINVQSHAKGIYGCSCSPTISEKPIMKHNLDSGTLTTKTRVNWIGNCWYLVSILNMLKLDPTSESLDVIFGMDGNTCETAFRP